MSLTLPIHHAWDGTPLPVDARAAVQLSLQGAELVWRTLAPWSRDPVPPGPPGPTPRLWEHEVVELFISGPGEAYLELELGPQGHHLVLQLHGVRNAVASGLPMEATTRTCSDGLWTGEARVPCSWLPAAPHRVNAYRIHGQPTRAYAAATPLPGPQPDFHQPHRFPPAALPTAPGDVRTDLRDLVAALGWVDPEQASTLVNTALSDRDGNAQAAILQAASAALHAWRATRSRVG